MGRPRRACRLLGSVTAALVLVTGCSSAGGGSATPPSGTADEPAVASTTVTFEDPSRTTSTGPGGEPLPGRELETTIWYPEDDDGPHPLVLFSHGYLASPEDYAELIARWVAAGTVVAAPRFPLTAGGTLELRTDVPEQPLDDRFVLDQVLQLNETPGSDLEGRIDPERIAAAGHSAGALTTAFLLTDTYYDDRVDAALLLAGGELSYLVPELTDQPASSFVQPGKPMLFVHGAADDAIPLWQGQQLYSYAPGPKAFLELQYATHSRPYDDPSDDSWPVIADSTTAYLAWALDLDGGGLDRMRAAVDDDAGAELSGDELP
jgi:fermentation-respiration switch protein FrsA (DUF1100 family)